VAWASSFIKSGAWDRKRFNGRELYGKRLGIIGLGRIGSLVAARAQGFAMDVAAFDPYIPASRFEKLGVERCESLDDLVSRADFLTIHTPRTRETVGIIGDREIGLMKDGVILVNCARGGLYDELALERALASGKIGALGLDVWNQEPQSAHPLYSFDTVVGTPHLGASTFEAQERVGREVVAEVLAGLRGEIVKNAVNIPSISESTYEKLRPFISLAERMGKAYRGIRGGRVEEIAIEFAGPQVDDPEDVKLLSLVVLKGILDGAVPGTVNFVNAEAIARQRGISLSESVSRGTGDYGNLVTLRVREEAGSAFELVGTVLERRHPRIVRMGEYEMDFVPEGRVLHIPHRNVPGVIGKMGLACARYGVNISRMIVSDGSRDSLMLVTVDNPVEPALVAELEAIDELGEVRIVEL
ncbi:MAG: NAD(P)-dependent oxidoreductase, partial [Spirochaetaceae bacterium]|nr:NAD(P)-dependent oxidoreductase [Spirochaetaceae bacterium]